MKEGLYDCCFGMYIFGYNNFYILEFVSVFLMGRDKLDLAVNDLEKGVLSLSRRPGSVIFYGGDSDVRKKLAELFNKRTGVSTVLSSLEKREGDWGYSIDVGYIATTFGLF